MIKRNRRVQVFQCAWRVSRLRINSHLRFRKLWPSTKVWSGRRSDDLAFGAIASKSRSGWSIVLVDSDRQFSCRLEALNSGKFRHSLDYDWVSDYSLGILETPIRVLTSKTTIGSQNWFRIRSYQKRQGFRQSLAVGLGRSSNFRRYTLEVVGDWVNTPLGILVGVDYG